MMGLGCVQDACNEFGWFSLAVVRRLLTVIALLDGVFTDPDLERRRDIGRRYLGLTAVPTARSRVRVEDIYSMEHLPLEEDEMKYFLPEKCGRVPTISNGPSFFDRLHTQLAMADEQSSCLVCAA